MESQVVNLPKFAQLSNGALFQIPRKPDSMIQALKYCTYLPTTALKSFTFPHLWNKGIVVDIPLAQSILVFCDLWAQWGGRSCLAGKARTSRWAQNMVIQEC